MTVTGIQAELAEEWMSSPALERVLAISPDSWTSPREATDAREDVRVDDTQQTAGIFFCFLRTFC
jgi:hypothetical protein